MKGRRAEMAASMRQRYTRLRAANICVACGSRPRAPWAVRCPPCLKTNSDGKAGPA